MRTLLVLFCFILAPALALAQVPDAGAAVLAQPAVSLPAASSSPAWVGELLFWLGLLLPSIVTGLTRYRQFGGLSAVLDFLSFFTHRDSPGTLQMPLLQVSKAPPSLLLVLALLLGSARLAHGDAGAAVPRPLLAAASGDVAADVKTQPPAILSERDEAAAAAVPPPAPGPSCPEPCAACGQKLSTVGPRSFWDGTGGKVVVAVFSLIGTGVSVLQSLQSAGIIGH